MSHEPEQHRSFPKISLAKRAREVPQISDKQDNTIHFNVSHHGRIDDLNRSLYSVSKQLASHEGLNTAAPLTTRPRRVTVERIVNTQVQTKMLAQEQPITADDDEIVRHLRPYPVTFGMMESLVELLMWEDRWLVYRVTPISLEVMFRVVIVENGIKPDWRLKTDRFKVSSNKGFRVLLYEADQEYCLLGIEDIGDRENFRKSGFRCPPILPLVSTLYCFIFLGSKR